MPTPDLVFKSGQELAALIKTRKVSPVEVTEAFLDRAEMLNPRVNAFITVTRDHALAAARVGGKGNRCRQVPRSAAWPAVCAEGHPCHEGDQDDEWVEGHR